MDITTKKAVLEHQLAGVLFHMDCATMYHMAKKRRLCFKHYHQAKEEILCHIKSRFELSGDGYVSVDDVEKVGVSSLEDIPTKWESWERETRKMYARLVELEPKRKLWQELLHDVEKELRCLQKHHDEDKMQTNNKNE